ncbi:unnamed protein product [Ambrosiozyma monospora]|uniref:Unnamed protein product n=1 Tax=Ambrosiozyma monospora TaxID=43982 RepID=A0ACB5U7C1_AMBMO|nr:unnamed protein product [Ambrosiozyma monospora]
MSSYSSNLEPRAIQRPRNSSVSFGNSHTLGRSFVYSSFKPELNQSLNNTPAIHSTNDIHEQTADLADVGVTNVDDDNGDDPSMLLYEPIGGAGNNIYNSPPGQESPYKETSPLVTGPSESTSLRYAIIILYQRP